MTELLDANVWMEALRNRPRAEEVSRYIEGAPDGALAISRMALHSIGIALFRHKALHIYPEFIRGAILDNGIIVLEVPTPELGVVSDTALALGLDFEDAYQYAVAEQYDLTLVSFDKDFDRTPRGRKTPAEVTP